MPPPALDQFNRARKLAGDDPSSMGVNFYLEGSMILAAAGHHDEVDRFSWTACSAIPTTPNLLNQRAWEWLTREKISTRRSRRRRRPSRSRRTTARCRTPGLRLSQDEQVGRSITGLATGRESDQQWILRFAHIWVMPILPRVGRPRRLAAMAARPAERSGEPRPHPTHRTQSDVRASCLFPSRVAMNPSREIQPRPAPSRGAARSSFSARCC